MEKYSIIYADPSWSFNNKKTGGNMKSGASQQYSVMTVAEMSRLPIPAISEDNAVLFMWWVGSQSVEAIRLCNAWGFELKTMTGFVWIKTTKPRILPQPVFDALNKIIEKFKLTVIFSKLFFGMGFWTRAGSECCLIATKGTIRRSEKKGAGGVRSVFFAPVEEHSKKPAIVRDMIVELMGDLPRVELFARQETEGWKVWGNEVENPISLP